MTQPYLFSKPLQPHLRHPRRKKGSQMAAEWFPITIGSVLLAVDPAITTIGFAVLKKTEHDPIRVISGILRPKADGEKNRFNVLFDQISRIAKLHECTDAVIEHPNRGKAWSGMSYDDVRANSRAIGAIEAACYAAGLTVNLVRVHEWKSNKKKSSTFAEVKAIFKYSPPNIKESHNEVDAIMLGAFLCWR